MIDDLKEKFHHTKIHEELHDAKVAFIHQKLALPAYPPPSPQPCRTTD